MVAITCNWLPSIRQNLFEVMMGSGEILSLGQITNALFEVGGKYRRNM